MPALKKTSSPSLKLPQIAQSQLDVKPIDWGDLPRRFLNAGELEVLIALLRSVSPERVIELGTNEGRTAAAVLNNVAGVRHYIGVDVLPGYHFKCAVQSGELPKEPGYLAAGDGRFELLLRPRGSLDVTVEDLGEADAIFIDGDHSREVVGHDSELARRVINRGGIIIWHDYHNLETVEVRPVLELLAQSGREILHVENTWLAFERW